MDNHALLAAVGVSRRYPRRGALLVRGNGSVPALRGVSLRVAAGDSLGVLGPSGSGKSTLARLLAGLECPDEGNIALRGVVVSPGPQRSLAVLRRSVQLVFQDPGAAMNPRQRVAAVVEEPLTVRGLSRREARRRGGELLEQVGLPGWGDLAKRLPRDLSGGERQRVALARALACDPEILVLDEPTAALDVSVRGQVVNLLQHLRKQRRLALVVASHDLGLVAALCQRILVLACGVVVDEGESRELLANPQHPTTAALVAVSAWARGRRKLQGAGHVTPSPGGAAGREDFAHQQ